MHPSFRTTHVALTLLTILAPIAAGEAPSAPPAPDAPILTTPTGAYVIGQLTLGETPVTVAFRDGKPVQLWARKALPGSKMDITYVDEVAGTTNEARFVVRGFSTKGAGVQEMTLTLTLGGLDGAASGTFTTVDKGGAELAKGQVTGTFMNEAALRARDAIAAGQDWPSFNGAEGGNRAVAYAKPLIDDLTKAKPLWRSESRSYSGWGTGADGRYANRAAFMGLNGGSSSPIAKDGIVYLYSYLPSGDVSLEDANAKTGSKKIVDVPEAVGRDTYRRFFSTVADVQVVAMDAVTGKTIWQSVWPMKQGNFQTHKWRADNFCPVVSEGILLVMDYSWNLYAHDAKTGKLLWTKGKNRVITSNEGNVGPAVNAGKFVITGRSQSTAYDLKTGAEIWKAPGGYGSRAITIDGKPRFLICADPLLLLDAENGKELSKLPFPALEKEKGGKAYYDSLKSPLQVQGSDFYTCIATDLKSQKETQGKIIAFSAAGDKLEERWRSEMTASMEDSQIAVTVNDAGIFTAFQDKGSFLFDRATGKTLGNVPGVRSSGSNPTHLSIGNRVIAQPECQHGSQEFSYFDTTGGTLKLLGQPKIGLPHNDTTAYGVMPIANIVIDGRLITRGIDGVYCYDLRADK